MEQTLPHTRILARHLYGISYDSLTPHCVDVAKMCVQDFIGVALAGSQKKEAEIWRSYYGEKASAPEAALFAPHFPRMTAEQAASVNAAAGHVMDLDDVHNASITHLGALTIPTAFALGQRLHKSGREVLAAVAAGYEAGPGWGPASTPLPIFTGIPPGWWEPWRPPSPPPSCWS